VVYKVLYEVIMTKLVTNGLLKCSLNVVKESRRSATSEFKQNQEIQSK
jgi:hypothetical protein